MSITIDQLTVRFDDGTAVNNINYKVSIHEFVSLFDPSGCGKSTTPFMRAGISTPTSGQIYLQNKNITKTAPKIHDIGMVCQHCSLYPHMTVL